MEELFIVVYTFVHSAPISQMLYQVPHSANYISVLKSDVLLKWIVKRGTFLSTLTDYITTIGLMILLQIKVKLFMTLGSVVDFDGSPHSDLASYDSMEPL